MKPAYPYAQCAGHRVAWQIYTIGFAGEQQFEQSKSQRHKHRFARIDGVLMARLKPEPERG